MNNSPAEAGGAGRVAPARSERADEAAVDERGRARDIAAGLGAAGRLRPRRAPRARRSGRAACRARRPRAPSAVEPLRSPRAPSSQRTRAVSILPGAIRLTVMPLGPSSSASVLTRPWMPGGRRWRSRGRSVALIDDEAIETMRPDRTPRGTAPQRGPAGDRQQHRLEGLLPGLVVEAEQRPGGGPPRFVAGCRGRRTASAARSTSRRRAVGGAEVDAHPGDLRARRRPRPSPPRRRPASLSASRPAHHHVHALAGQRAGDRLAEAVAGSHEAARRPTRSSSMAGTLHARRARGSVRCMSTALSTLAEYARANPRSQAAHERALSSSRAALTHDARRAGSVPALRRARRGRLQVGSRRPPRCSTT